ncbi:cysteine hydrolase family protein [Guggenheimella bovis]
MVLEELQFGSQTIETLENIRKNLKVKTLVPREVNTKKTLLVNVDVINGFVKQGALASPRVEKIVPFLVDLNTKLDRVKRVFLYDSHTPTATEFMSYPSHCIQGTKESQVVSELLPFTEDSEMIAKNSTNAFHAEAFKKLLDESYNRVLFVGDVTDICVLQGALTTLTYFDQWDRVVDVGVIIEGVETFDLEATNHDGDLMNLLSLYLLQQNGVELYSVKREG